MPRIFILPVITWILALVGIFIWGGIHAFMLAAVLTVLEITLSFDNAVVNAKVLTKMSPAWQSRFLTWGILFAVVFTRFVLPILIVAAAVMRSPAAIAEIAFSDPGAYAALLEHAKPLIASFGGAFLMMVSLRYFIDEDKDVHWLAALERGLSKIGRIEAFEIAFTLALVALMAAFLPNPAGVLFAGVIGVILFIVMEGITSAFTLGSSAAAGGLALFLYLNVLDAAFSLDGVVGAFAITGLIPVIVVGLGVGAYFVRSITLYLVREKTLDSLAYLEHGAHYAILVLALAMFASLFFEVPEVATGGLGLLIVAAAIWSSLRERKKDKHLAV